MKKFLVIATLIVLSSCSLLGNKAPTTFEEYYTRNILATIDSTEKTLRSLGLFRSSEISGVIDALISIPVIFSGSIMTDYALQSDGRNASLIAQNSGLQYTGLAGSGGLSFDTIGLISEGGNLHILYKNLQDMALSTPEMREIFKKYDGNWLSWTREEARESTEDPIELQAMNMIENLSKIDKKQVEKYLVDYQVWKSTEDMGMSGALHVYKIELDREKVLSLMNIIKTDLTGAAFSIEEQSALREQLALVGLSGTMGFHPDSTDVSEMVMNLADGSGATLGTLTLFTESRKTELVLTSTQENISLNYTYTDGETREDMLLTVSQAGTEVGKMTGYIDTQDGDFRELSLDMTAQGITVTMRHTQDKDGKFEGRLLLPVGSISWNGAVSDKILTSLKILGASPMGAMDLNLTQDGDRIRGPFVLRVGEEELMRATVGLIIEPERFRLALDIPQGSGSTDIMHGELGWTMKRSDFSGKIKAPTNTKPLRDLFTELEKIAPEQFVEEPQMDLDEPQFILNDKDSLEPMNPVQ